MKKKFHILPVIIRFSQEISADKVVLIRIKKDKRTLLKQLEDAVIRELK